jgi:hypothetical protein
MVSSCLDNISDPQLTDAVRTARTTLDHATSWLAEAERFGQPALEAGARRFSLTLGRLVELALLIKHAQWSYDYERDKRSMTSARRFAHSGVDLIWTGFQNLEDF